MDMARQEKGALPGSTTMLVLALLRSEEMYGYQIIEELEKRSEEVFKLKEGTLYPILHTLEKERLVTAREAEAPNGRQRRYYRITPAGEVKLAQYRMEWAEYRKNIEHVLFE
jgi:PadR family transcriptional regulator PadR